jgi:hypothetical protein
VNELLEHRHEQRRCAELMEHLRTIDTPTICNAIERFGIRPKASGFAPVEIRCLFPEFGPMCAYAVTAQVETATESHRKTEEARTGRGLTQTAS